jgi:hypothetical protein
VTLTLVTGTFAARGALADGAGNDTLSRARAAWDRGEFDTAEPLYKEALDRGGLAPKDTLECYVRLGAARAVLGRKHDALIAFRQAALLDPRFVVPTDAGRKAVTYATQARKEQTKIGPFVLRADAPDSVPANKPFRVMASIDGTHAALITKIGVVAKEPVSDKSFEKSDPAATSVTFEVPATIAAGDQTLTVRVDALDPHDNRLVSVEKKVKVGPAPPEPAAPVAAAGVGAKASGGTQAKTAQDWSKPIPEPAKDKDTSKKSGGFWSTPWPYVIGGVALAAGGAAVYLGTRPTDDVAVGGAAVRVR